MKGIFVAALVLCLSACASQPEKAVTTDQASMALNASTASVNKQAAGPSTKVFKDDYTLLHSKKSHPRRQTLLLGSKKGE